MADPANGCQTANRQLTLTSRRHQYQQKGLPRRRQEPRPECSTDRHSKARCCTAVVGKRRAMLDAVSYSKPAKHQLGQHTGPAHSKSLQLLNLCVSVQPESIPGVFVDRERNASHTFDRLCLLAALSCCSTTLETTVKHTDTGLCTSTGIGKDHRTPGHRPVVQSRRGFTQRNPDVAAAHPQRSPEAAALPHGSRGGRCQRQVHL